MITTVYAAACAAFLAMMGCGGDTEGADDELCEEILSPDGKVRCRDTTMVKSVRAYRRTNGNLHVELRGELLRENPEFYIEMIFDESAQQAAPQSWNWMGNEGISTTFYDLARDPQARSDFYSFPPERGAITISDYSANEIRGVIRNFRYADTAQNRGVALVPTMRFDIGCVGDPANDDPSCAGKCGACAATDRCGNEVVVALEPCP